MIISYSYMGPRLPTYDSPPSGHAPSDARAAIAPSTALGLQLFATDGLVNLRASLPPDCGMALSPPIANVPDPHELAHQFPDMPVSLHAVYTSAYHGLCIAQMSYFVSYVARGNFWRHANEMTKFIDGLQPPPPYSP